MNQRREKQKNEYSLGHKNGKNWINELSSQVKKDQGVR